LLCVGSISTGNVHAGTLGFVPTGFVQLANCPAKVGPRDIRFNKTRIDNALRMLAEVGRFNLVIDGPLNKLVSATFIAVEPYDVLLSISKAHGLGVRCHSGVVHVTATP
jgi:hypothetical protein